MTRNEPDPRRDDHLPSRPSRTQTPTTSPGEAARAIAASAFHVLRGDTDLTPHATDLILETAARPDVHLVLTHLARLTGALLHREGATRILTREAHRDTDAR